MATKAEKLLAKGQGLEKKGKRDKALEVFRDACKEHPYDLDLWTARAEAALGLGQTAEGADALFKVSDMYARGGLPREALRIARRVLEVDKGHGGARRFLRMLEARLEEDAQTEVKEKAEPAPAPDVAPVQTITFSADEPEPMEIFRMPEAVSPTSPSRAPTPRPAAREDRGDEARQEAAPPAERTELPSTLSDWLEDTRPPKLAGAEPGSPAVEEPVAEAPVAELPAVVVVSPASVLAAIPRVTRPPRARIADDSGPVDLTGAVKALAGDRDSGAVVSEFAVGSMTGDIALESLSLVERLPQTVTSDGARGADIALDDEAKLDVVEAVASTVGSSPLLAELDSDLVKTLVDCGTLVHRDEGEDVFRQGELGASLYLILQGEVAVLSEAQGNGQSRAAAKELARLRPGAFFGEMAILTNSPRSATVRACKKVALLEVSRKSLRDLIAREARVLKLLMRFFRARLVGTLLQTSPLFQPLSREERRGLVGRFRLREIPTDRVVFAEGAPAEGLFVVLVGRLEVARAHADAPQILAMLGPGDVFGEMSLLDGSPAMATVRARHRAWVLLLPSDVFSEVTEAHPEMRQQLEVLASDRHRQNQAVIDHGAPLVVAERLQPV
jgi:CRP-like cAMP-binding protein